MTKRKSRTSTEDSSFQEPKAIQFTRVERTYHPRPSEEQWELQILMKFEETMVALNKKERLAAELAGAEEIQDEERVKAIELELDDAQKRFRGCLVELQKLVPKIPAARLEAAIENRVSEEQFENLRRESELGVKFVGRPVPQEHLEVFNRIEEADRKDVEKKSMSGSETILPPNWESMTTISRAQAAKELGVTVRTVFTYIRDGKLQETENKRVLTSSVLKMLGKKPPGTA